MSLFGCRKDGTPILPKKQTAYLRCIEDSEAGLYFARKKLAEIDKKQPTFFEEVATYSYFDAYGWYAAFDAEIFREIMQVWETRRVFRRKALW